MFSNILFKALYLVNDIAFNMTISKRLRFWSSYLHFGFREELSVFSLDGYELEVRFSMIFEKDSFSDLIAN